MFFLNSINPEVFCEHCSMKIVADEWVNQSPKLDRCVTLPNCFVFLAFFFGDTMLR